MAAQPFFTAVSDYPSDHKLEWTEEMQGITHDENYWYISQKNKLWKIPLDADLDHHDVHVNSLAFPQELSDLGGYDHMGDLDYHAGFLFVPIEKKDSNLTARISVFNASDLGYLDSAEVPLQGNKAPYVAVNPANGLLYSSRDDRIKSLFAYKFSIDANCHFSLTLDHECSLLEPNGMPLGFNHIQGATFTDDNLLFIVSGEDTRGVFVFRMPECRQIQFIGTGWDLWTVGEELEGVTYWDADSGRAPGIRGQLHVLEMDNDYLLTGGGDDDLKCFKHFRRHIGKFVANKRRSSREVHYCGCAWANRISPQNQVGYDDLQDAINDGFDGCHFCLDQYDTR